MQKLFGAPTSVALPASPAGGPAMPTARATSPCGAAALDDLLTITVFITRLNFSLSFAGHVPYDFRPKRSHNPQTVPWGGGTARRRVGDGI
jgi:hypothetical protein